MDVGRQQTLDSINNITAFLKAAFPWSTPIKLQSQKTITHAWMASKSRAEKTLPLGGLRWPAILCMLKDTFEHFSLDLDRT